MSDVAVAVRSGFISDQKTNILIGTIQATFDLCNCTFSQFQSPFSSRPAIFTWLCVFPSKMSLQSIQIGMEVCS